METKFYVELEPFAIIDNPPEVTDGRIVIDPAENGGVSVVFVLTKEQLDHDEKSLFAVSAYELWVDEHGKLELLEIPH